MGEKIIDMNKSIIFKNAWRTFKIKREHGYSSYTFSEALSQQYMYARTPHLKYMYN